MLYLGASSVLGDERAVRQFVGRTVLAAVAGYATFADWWPHLLWN